MSADPSRLCKRQKTIVTKFPTVAACRIAYMARVNRGMMVSDRTKCASAQPSRSPRMVTYHGSGSRYVPCSACVSVSSCLSIWHLKHSLEMCLFSCFVSSHSSICAREEMTSLQTLLAPLVSWGSIQQNIIRGGRSTLAARRAWKQAMTTRAGTRGLKALWSRSAYPSLLVKKTIENVGGHARNPLSSASRASNKANVCVKFSRKYRE
jgi:hypothetical protein